MSGTHEYPFITNRSCEFFPCHEGVDPDEFNCLFCYCPLYLLGDACGGKFTRSKSGVKNCTACSLPHQGDNGTRMVKAHWAQMVPYVKIDPPSQDDAPCDGDAARQQGETNE